MKHIVVTAVFGISLLLVPQLLAASPVSATLTLPHNNLLPGVPFDLVVTFTNVSDQPITVDGAGATLVVTFEDDETVVMHKPELNDQWTVQGSTPVRLAPRESVQHAASWQGGSIPNWFHYHGASFSGPGTYRIALDLRIVDEHMQVLGTVRTPAVTLTRIDPIGIDAELWKRMQEVSDGRWYDYAFSNTKAGYALGSEIIELHPTSSYYPYIVALRAFDKSRDKNHIPVLLEAAERFPSSPAYHYLLTAIADCARQAGTVAARAGNKTEAQTYLALAETKYREALATKNGVVVRLTSERGLRNVNTARERVTKKQVR